MPLKRDPVAFPKLDDRQIAALEEFATLKTFRAGETLFGIGEQDFKFFVVKSGEVAIIDHSGGEHETVTVHQAREFTGDVDMLTGRAVLVSAIARTDCEVHEISAADLRRILNEMSQLSDVLLRAFLLRRQLFEGVRRRRCQSGGFALFARHASNSRISGEEQNAVRVDRS